MTTTMTVSQTSTRLFDLFCLLMADAHMPTLHYKVLVVNLCSRDQTFEPSFARRKATQPGTCSLLNP
jgi:hypothetical protein